ncbi:MAG: hypothetical protein ABW352_13625 [Polyangiales bacterium]
MTWARCVAISGLALALGGVWTSVRAQPDASATGKVQVGGRTTTKLKPQHSLRVDAGASGAVDAGVGDASVETVEAAPPPAPPPLDDLPPANEIPPPPEKVTAPHGALPPGVRAFGRQDPLMRHVRLDGHVALSWDGAFGVGVRADWLLIEGTFKYSQRDELAVSAGADVTFVKFDGTQVVEVYPTAVLQWSIGVNDRLFLYPEFGFVGHVDDGRWDGLFPNIGFGTRYYLARSIGLHARFGWPIAFSAGAVF